MTGAWSFAELIFAARVRAMHAGFQLRMIRCESWQVPHRVAGMIETVLPPLEA
jgi:hypothetical protein